MTRLRTGAIRPARWLAVVAASVLAVLASASPGEAHAFLVRTTPESGERLTTAPPEITLHFSEQFVRGSAELSVRAAHGRRVQLGPLSPTDGGVGVRVGLPPLGEAIYVVSWGVDSTDGHRSEGEFAFAVGDVGGRLPALEARSESIPIGDTVVTALFLGGLAIALGGLASERFVWRRHESHGGVAPRRAPVASALVVAAAGAAGHFALTARSESWGAAFDTRAGALAVVELAAVVYALWMLRVPRFRILAFAPLAVAVVAAAFRGHSGASDVWWAAPGNALHLLLGGLWMGALVHLVLVLWRLPGAERRTALAGSVHRYASLALVALPPLLALGVATVLAEIDHLTDLVDTRYGQILLVKLGLVATALLLAVTARLRTLTPSGERLPGLRRLTRTEAGALLLVIAVSAVLVNAAPPGPGTAAGTLLGPPPLQGDVQRAADLAGQLPVFAATTADALRIETLTPGGERLRAERVNIDGVRPDGSTFSLFPRSCGRGCLTVRTEWPEGATRLEARVSARGWRGGTAALTIFWPPGPDATATLEQLVASMRAQPAVEIREQVSSGPRGGVVPNSATLPGAEFIAQELYAAGGATDVRALPTEDGLAGLSLWIPGSATWVRLWFDDQLRLRRELIVNPGHRIERTLAYPSAAVAG